MFKTPERALLFFFQFQAAAAGVGQLGGRHLHLAQAHRTAHGAALQGRVRALLPARVPGGERGKKNPGLCSALLELQL